MILSAQVIGLGATTGEGIKDNDLWRARNADIALPFVAEQQTKVVDQLW